MDPSFWWTCIGIAALIGMSAFFSGSETALTAFNRAAMHQLSAKGRKGARVALIVVHPHLLEAPGFFRRFLREAEIGKTVRHPIVVRTYDCDATGGRSSAATTRTCPRRVRAERIPDTPAVGSDSARDRAWRAPRPAQKFTPPQASVRLLGCP